MINSTKISNFTEENAHPPKKWCQRLLVVGFDTHFLPNADDPKNVLLQHKVLSKTINFFQQILKSIDLKAFSLLYRRSFGFGVIAAVSCDTCIRC